MKSGNKIHYIFLILLILNSKYSVQQQLPSITTTFKTEQFDGILDYNASCMVQSQDILFIGDDIGGLKVARIVNNQEIKKIAQLQMEKIENMILTNSGKYLFAFINKQLPGPLLTKITVINVENLENIQIKGSFNLQQSELFELKGFIVSINDNVLYMNGLAYTDYFVLGSYKGVTRIIDFSDKQNPVEILPVKEYSNKLYPTSMQLGQNGSYIYASTNGVLDPHLKIFQLSADFKSISQTFITNHQTKDVLISSDKKYLYTRLKIGQLQILDIQSDPINPIQKGALYFSGPDTFLLSQNGDIIIIGDDIMDITTPTFIKKIGSYKLSFINTLSQISDPSGNKSNMILQASNLIKLYKIERPTAVFHKLKDREQDLNFSFDLIPTFNVGYSHVTCSYINNQYNILTKNMNSPYTEYKPNFGVVMYSPIYVGNYIYAVSSDKKIRQWYYTSTTASSEGTFGYAISLQKTNKSTCYIGYGDEKLFFFTSISTILNAAHTEDIPGLQAINTSYSLVPHDSTQFLISQDYKAYIINISVCNNPQIQVINLTKKIVGQFVLTEDKNYLIYGAYGDELIVLNISQPQNPIIAKKLSNINIHSLQMIGGYETLIATGEATYLISIKYKENPIFYQKIDQEGQTSQFIQINYSSKIAYIFRKDSSGNGFMIQYDIKMNDYIMVFDDSAVQVNKNFKKNLLLFKSDQSGPQNPFSVTRVNLINEHGQSHSLPNWLVFHNTTQTLEGTPTKVFSNQKMIFQIDYQVQSNEGTIHLSLEVQPTLKIDLEPNKISVSSPSTFMSMKFQLPSLYKKDYIKFVLKDIGAVSYNFDSQQGELVMFGPTSEMVKATKKIRYTFLKPPIHDPSQIYLQLIIDDLVNEIQIINENEQVTNIGLNMNLFSKNQPPQITQLQSQRSLIKNMVSIKIPLFSDPENDQITYTAWIVNKQGNAENLPQWLSFQENIMLLSGQPPVDLIAKGELETTLKIQITGDDSYDKASMQFDLTIYNEPPKVIGQIDSDFKEKITSGHIKTHPDTKFEFPIPETYFQDSDKLFYTASVRRIKSNNNNSTRLLTEDLEWEEIKEATEHWLKFSNDLKKFYGIPQSDDLGNYEIKLKVSDSFTDIDQNFSFQIDNKPPYVNRKLQDQLVVKPVINQVFEFQFAENTFLDADNDNLVYTLTEISGQQLPENFKFDPQNRVMTGNFDSLRQSDPNVLGEALGLVKKAYKLEITASDGIGKVVRDILILEVQISILYVIIKISEIGGPLVGILGLYKYRTLLYKILCQKKYKYEKANHVQVGSKFQKQLYMVGEATKVAGIVWKEINESQKKSNSVKSDLFKGSFIGEKGDYIDFFKLNTKINSIIIESQKLKNYQKFLIENLDSQWNIISLFIIAHFLQNQLKQKENKPIKDMYELLKSQTQQHYKTGELEWINIYLDSQSLKVSQYEIQNYQFPQITFNFKPLISLASRTKSEKQQIDAEKIKQLCKQDFSILKYLLIQDALGVMVSNTTLQKSKGLCLYVQESDIQQICTLIPNKDKNENKLGSSLGMGQCKLFLSNLHPTPAWIQFSQEYSVLTMEGVPTKADIGLSEMILKEFSIEVTKDMPLSDGKDNEINSLDSQKDHTLQADDEEANININNMDEKHYAGQSAQQYSIIPKKTTIINQIQKENLNKQESQSEIEEDQDQNGGNASNNNPNDSKRSSLHSNAGETNEFLPQRRYSQFSVQKETIRKSSLKRQEKFYHITQEQYNQKPVIDNEGQFPQLANRRETITFEIQQQ